MTEANLIEAIAAFNSSAQSWMCLYMSIPAATAYLCKYEQALTGNRILRGLSH